jgi:predicted nucleotidyltransferase component of viral defense system
MTPTPQHGTPAGDATLAIRGLARATGSDVQQLMTLYALEGLLGRLAHSHYKQDFVLKGGVLLAAFAARRPTRDIDLQATRLSSDSTDVVERIRAITSVDLHDGLDFDVANISASTIRDSDKYAGVRVKITASLGEARLHLGIDVNFGDPIWPAPQDITLPRIVPLTLPPLRVLGYPLTMVLAEKLVTAIDRGGANTRWRDFADLFVLTRLHPIDGMELRQSLETVAEYRSVTLMPLQSAVEPIDPQAQQKWKAWRARSRREEDLPQQFHRVILAISEFFDPVLSSPELKSWNPDTSVWET